MSKEYAEMFGLKIGEKVLYPHYSPYVVIVDVVTVKDVKPLWENIDIASELVLYVEEFDGYINPLAVYSMDRIQDLFLHAGGVK